MKKLSMLSLLVLSSCSIFSSDTTGSQTAGSYKGKLQAALAQRDAGQAGYDSGAERMASIRNPRRAQVGAEQESQEYFNAKSSMPGFKQSTPRERFVLKAKKYLAQVESGEMEPGQFKDMMSQKLAAYQSSMSQPAAAPAAPVSATDAV